MMDRSWIFASDTNESPLAVLRASQQNGRIPRLGDHSTGETLVSLTAHVAGDNVWKVVGEYIGDTDMGPFPPPVGLYDEPEVDWNDVSDWSDCAAPSPNDGFLAMNEIRDREALPPALEWRDGQMYANGRLPCFPVARRWELDGIHAGWYALGVLVLAVLDYWSPAWGFLEVIR